jgi:hypothetical protein
MNSCGQRLGKRTIQVLQNSMPTAKRTPPVMAGSNAVISIKTTS